jgi:hypothetical protein
MKKDLKTKLIALKQEQCEYKNKVEELNKQIYQIQRELGYYAKNEILYGVEYD